MYDTICTCIPIYTYVHGLRLFDKTNFKCFLLRRRPTSAVPLVNPFHARHVREEGMLAYLPLLQTVVQAARSFPNPTTARTKCPTGDALVADK